MPLHSLPDDNHHDFVAELTHRMARFLLSDDDTLHSPRDSIHESAEVCSQETSPSAAPEERSWKSGYDMSVKLQSFNTELYSHQSLVQEQIRAIELSGVKQDQVAVSAKQTPAPRRKNLGQTYEPKKGNVRRARPPRPGPQRGAGMRALFLDGPGSRGGTGVFLPRAGAPTPSESTNKQGENLYSFCPVDLIICLFRTVFLAVMFVSLPFKLLLSEILKSKNHATCCKGCSTVLIPARVVQALQLHFDQMGATSGPKAGAFHPLHDVVVSDRDGMYSFQNHQSQKAATSIQNETILPQEWAY